MILLLGNYLQKRKRFVDDTFEFVLPDKIGYMVNQINTFDENIQFTNEMKEYNKLAYLDVMVVRNTGDTSITKANKYRHLYELTLTYPIAIEKKATANVLIKRANRICSTRKLQDED